MVALLLFLNAFRIGTSATLGTIRQLRQTIVLVFVLQLLIPSALLLVFAVAGVTGPISTALIIMASAASIAGAFNITSLLGHNPAASQRLLIAGTAMLPLTILPVFYWSPELSDPTLITATALRLTLVIGVSAGLAYFLRATFFKQIGQSQLIAVDGFSVIVMSVVVIGLMYALGPAIFSEPLMVLVTVFVVFAANFGLQILSYYFLRWWVLEEDRVGISVVAGNRNMALFLAALPASITEPLLLFIACYQLPMYLTPLLLSKLYRSNSARPTTTP